LVHCLRTECRCERINEIQGATPVQLWSMSGQRDASTGHAWGTAPGFARMRVADMTCRLFIQMKF
jgi:hypothetical protein